MKKSTLLFAPLFLFLLNAVSNAQIKVTLLGTGVPLPSIERFGPSTLVEAGGQYLLFDCGRGASQRLWQKKVPLGKITKVFFTHLHSDHTVGFPDLWLTGWLPANYGKRSSAINIWGPTGIRQMMQSLRQAYDWDIVTRSHEDNKIDSSIHLIPHEIREGIVYSENGLTVTAFLVDHSDFIRDAYGYRIDYGGHSVLISGDTRYSRNLIKYAKGTDLLIHEVAVARPELIARSATARQILGYHSSPEDAARVFEEAAPRLAVFNHVVLLSTDPTIPPPTPADIIPRAKSVYKGAVVLGEDGMTLEVADQVRVLPAFADNASADSTIRRLEEEERMAIEKEDTVALARLLSTSVVVQNPENMIVGYRQIMDRVRTGKISYNNFERQIERISFMDNIAVVMGTETLVPKGNTQHAGKTVRRKFSNIWMKENNGWKLAARQATILSIKGENK